MQLDVTVQIEGEDVLAGKLYQNVRHGDETATFSYATSYLDDARAFALAPDMPLGPGAFHSGRRPSTTWQTVSRPVFAS